MSEWNRKLFRMLTLCVGAGEQFNAGEEPTLTTPTAPNPRILFLSLTDYSWSHRPVAEFGRLGCECAVMSPPDFACAPTRFAAVHFRLPRHSGLWLGLLAAPSRLERAKRDWRPDLIVPLDDVSAWLLRGLATDHSVSADLRRLIEASLGSPAGYDAVCSRVRFLELAKRIGVRAPSSRAVDKASAQAAAEAMGYPVMIKVDQTAGGYGVRIARDPAQLAEGMEACGLGQGGLLRRGRRAMRRLVWRLGRLSATPAKIFELQQYIRGVPAMRTMAAWQGRVLAGASFVSECVDPQPFGASTTVRFIDHPEMDATTERLVAALGISGFVSFDFVIAETGGAAFVIECNPRVISSSHLGRLFGQDLCGALARQLGWPAAALETAASPKEAPIALFPHEIARDPDSARLRSGSGILHDVPWDDPGVVQHCYRQLLQLHPGHAAAIARLLRFQARAVEGPV